MHSAMNELKGLIEALIFAAETPLSLERLVALTERPRSDVRAALDALRDDCGRAGRGLDLYEVGGGYQLRTQIDYAPYVRRLVKDRAIRLSQAALETLAIIAYRQPVTRGEIEYLRGVDSGAVVKSLLEKNLVKMLGRKDVPGRPTLYGTSRYFLEFFGLRELADLPTLKDFAALDPQLIEADPLVEEEMEKGHGH